MSKPAKQPILRNLARADGGHMAVMTALALTAVTGLAGMTVLYYQGAEQKTAIQAGLDAGVLAGTALPYTARDSERIAVAEAAFHANAKGGVFKASEKSAEFAAGTTPKPVFTVAKSEVSGVAMAKVKNSLGSALGITEMTVEVTARAMKRMSDPICLLAMNPSAATTVWAYGNAEIEARGCAIQSNSTNGEGLAMQGTRSAIAAKMIGTSGSSYRGENWTPKPMTGIAPVPDPYASLPVPEPGTCINAANKLANTTATLSPGTYCGGLEVKAGAVVHLEPGLYVMKDGPFKVNSGGRVTGDDVLIVLHGKDSIIHMLSGSYVKLSSPSKGTYRNIQFMSDRDLSKSFKNEEWTTILSGAILEFDGVAYLPEQNFWVSGTGQQVVVRGSSPSMTLLADTVWAQGNARLEFIREDRRGIGDDPARTGFAYGAMLVE